MNKLKNHRAYLSGAMDNADDFGTGWRKLAGTKLKEMGVIVFDPTNKPTDTAPEDMAYRIKKLKYKELKNWNGLASLMKQVRQIDLRLVDLSDFVVCHLDLNVRTCGTYEEIFLANRQKKPILIMCVQGKENIPDWMFGTIPHEHMFSSWDETFSYLRRINSGELVDDTRRWVFLNHV